VDADAQHDAPLGAGRGVPLDERLLDLDGRAHGLERARELDEEPVADRLHLGPAVPDEDRPDETPVLLEQLEREGLVPLGEGGVADHVGEHDGGEPALLGLAVRHARASRAWSGAPGTAWHARRQPAPRSLAAPGSPA